MIIPNSKALVRKNSPQDTFRPGHVEVGKRRKELYCNLKESEKLLGFRNTVVFFILTPNVCDVCAHVHQITKSVMSDSATPWTVAHQVPLSMEFSRQKYWSRLPCPPPGDLPDPDIKPGSLMSVALANGFLTSSTA